MKIAMLILCLIVLIAGLPCVSMSAEKNSIVINLDGKNYAAELEDNVTVRDILEGLPLSLDIQRYAGHEYYAELPFRPEFAAERTSHIKAGHLYYWDGWNAFVINYEEYDITPYKVVHLGKINNADEICAYLRKANDIISININQ